MHISATYLTGKQRRGKRASERDANTLTVKLKQMAGTGQCLDDSCLATHRWFSSGDSARPEGLARHSYAIG